MIRIEPVIDPRTREVLFRTIYTIPHHAYEWRRTIPQCLMQHRETGRQYQVTGANETRAVVYLSDKYGIIHTIPYSVFHLVFKEVAPPF